MALRGAEIFFLMPLPGFTVQIADLWAKATAATGTTRNCHYMPQFLMRRWAQNEALTVQDIKTGSISTHPTKAIRKRKKKNAFLPVGFEIDLYSTWDGSKEDRSTLEALFGMLEGDTNELLNRMATNAWSFSDQDRFKLALFVAASALRLPTGIRAVQDDWQADFDQISPEAKQKPGNTAHAILKVIFKDTAEKLYANPHWAIVTFQPPNRQHTADIPLVLATRGTVPVSNDPSKWEVHMPLDPQALLTIGGMEAPGQPLPSGTLRGGTPFEWSPGGATTRIL